MLLTKKKKRKEHNSTISIPLMQQQHHNIMSAATSSLQQAVISEPDIAAHASSTPLSIWELPEVLIYHTVGFVAPPTHRAQVLCHQIAPLCKDARKVVLDSERSVALWDAVLIGDYGIDKSKGYHNNNNNNNNNNTTKNNNNRPQRERRCCKRLRRSPCHQVRDAHKLLKDNTEIAFFYLSELAHSTTSNTAKNKDSLLSKRRLCGILDEYGPFLRLNHRVSSGGTFLVEVCRARNVKETVILRCVEELVEQRGALVDLQTGEAQNSQLTALCVAAVRGMPSVVKYLLQKGASAHQTCSGRFRLSANSRKSVRCNNAAPLEFAKAMKQDELMNGATVRDVVNLNKCIQLLSKN